MSKIITMDPLKQTEKAIQQSLYSLYKNRPYIFTNTYYFENESDLLTFTDAGYLYDYEIKRSRPDFFADKKKVRYKMLVDAMKKKIYSCINLGCQEWICSLNYGSHFVRVDGERVKKIYVTGREHQAICHISFKEIAKNVANKFYYVVPEGLISISECPDFAGLVYVNKEGAYEAKKAPTLHKNTFDVKKLFPKLYAFYDQRNNNN